MIFLLNILQKIEWKVPITNFFENFSPINLAILSFISFAALFVKVRASIFSAGIFLIVNKYIILYVNTLVLPEPAPDRTI